MIRTAVFLAVAFSSAFANAGSSLICRMDKAFALVIDPQTETVSYSFFMGIKKPLKLRYFAHGRCPHCYTFKGVVNGKVYEGTTHATGSPASGQMAVTLETVIDGVKKAPVACAPGI